VIYVSMFACVLAFGALTLAVVAWRISSTHARRVDSWRATTTTHWQKLYAESAKTLRDVRDAQLEMQRSTPTKLAAEVADLSEAVSRLAATHRRFAGRFHAARQHEPVSNGETDLDPEIAAHLALQAAPRPPGG